MTKRFEQILRRAENCKKYLIPNQTIPIPELLLYQRAINISQNGSLDELLGNFAK